MKLTHICSYNFIASDEGILCLETSNETSDINKDMIKQKNVYSNTTLSSFPLNLMETLPFAKIHNNSL